MRWFDILQALFKVVVFFMQKMDVIVSCEPRLQRHCE